MALFQAVQCRFPGPIQAVINANGANVAVPVVGDFVVPASMAANDVIEFVAIPSGYVPVDFILSIDAIAAVATMDIGVITGNFGALLDVAGAARACGSEGSAAAAGAAAAVLRMTKIQLAVLAPTLGDPTTTPVTSGDRGFGVRLLAGFATPTVGARMRMTLLVRPRIDGV